MNADSKKIRLQSSDGKVVEVDVEIIKLSNLVKTKMEDLPESDTIQLPNVNGAILKKVVQWCEFHKNDSSPLEEDENNKKRTDDEVKSWNAKFLKANQGDLYDLSLAANYMGVEGLLDLMTPIRKLPSELLVKIIEKLPRSQWPALELIDHKFQDAVLLAWGSLRIVDVERDFIYSESKAVRDENDVIYARVGRNLRRQIAQKTEAILKKLSERSPFITTLSGLSFITDNPNLNTTAVQYLSEFEHLETIKIAKKVFLGRVVNSLEFNFWCDISLVNLAEFVESTKSRATLKEIDIERCHFPDDCIMDANFDRLQAAFANVPPRQSLRLESFSMQTHDHRNYPLTFIDAIDGSRMTKLSFGWMSIDPTVLTSLINGAPHLQHLDFSFLKSCISYGSTAACQGRCLQPNKQLLAALESRQSLTSLGFNSIWIRNENGCTCRRFEAEFKKMLHTIAPQLVSFVFKPLNLPPDIRMGEIRDIIQKRMPCLKSITLDRYCAENPEELRGIADGKELEEIEIMASYKLTMHDVLLTILSKSPRLKRFNGHSYYPDHRVAAELFKLSELIDLRFRADQLTKKNFVAISQQVFAEKLQVLHLGSIGEGVQRGLIKVIQKATQLRELVVERNVTDPLLICLAQSCPYLEKFDATLADGITLSFVQMLLDRCPKLRWLGLKDMDYTPAISFKDLKVDRYRKLDLYRKLEYCL